jgi:serine/threonine-protein kinase
MRTLLGGAAGLLVASAGAPAWADISAADKALSDSLFDSGRDLLKAGNAAEACPKLEQSERIYPRVGTLLYLATCHEQIGKTASAWLEFHDALAQLSGGSRPEREEYARAHLAALETRLSRIVIRVQSPPEGVEVRIDNQRLQAASLGGSLPVDPGDHRVEASAPNRKTWSTTVAVRAGPSEQPVDVPALEVATTGTPPVQPVAHPEGRSSAGGAPRTLGFVGLAVGVIGVGIGTYFGIDAINKKNEANAGGCGDTTCPTPHGIDLYNQAGTSAAVSTISFGVGIVGLAAGAYLLLFRHDGPKQNAVQWVPSPGGLSIRASF